MLMISRRLGQLNGSAARSDASAADLLDRARQALYRGQCNCSYWHGAFGGIYLPHLRNAVYQQLIAADNYLDQVAGRDEAWVEATVGDYNLDARQEVRLASDKLVALLAPAGGGHLYELDVRAICHNLLATLARRPEAYHRNVLAGPGQGLGHVASIHDRVVFKQEGLDQRVQYDRYARKSLVDHFYDNEATPEAVLRGEAEERGDFAAGVYQSKIRRSQDRVQVQLIRQGNAWGIPLRITKAVTLRAGNPGLEIAYLLEGLPQDRLLHFAVEMNFAGLPSGADDRYFYQGEARKRLGHLGSILDLDDVRDLGLVDEWLGIDVRLDLNRESRLWTFPIETVSQSEGGFELVHQSLVVQPHWLVQGDADGRWSVTLNLAMDTSRAENRCAEAAVTV
jgi:alpha-amylase